MSILKKPKILPNNSFLIFLCSTLFGVVIFSQLQNKFSYLYLSFYELLSILVTAFVGVVVAKYLGEKLNRNSKLLDTVNTIIDKIEVDINHIIKSHRRINKKENIDYCKEIISSSFTHSTQLIYILLESKNSIICELNDLTVDLNKEVGIFFDLITGDRINNLENSVEDVSIPAEKKYKEISALLYSYKIKLFS